MAPIIVGRLEHLYGAVKYLRFTCRQMFRVFKDDHPASAIEPGKIGQAVIESIPVLAEPVREVERPCYAAEKACFAGKALQVDSNHRKPGSCGRLLDFVRIAGQLADIGLFGISELSCAHGDKPLRILRNVR